MRSLFSIVTLAAAVAAQSPLTTTFANNNGGAAGGAVYFELECLDPAGVTMVSLDLNFSGAAGQSGSIDVYYKAFGQDPHTSPDWVGPICSGAVTSTQGAGTPTTVGLAPSIQLGTGCRVGVAIVANGVAHAYTNGTGLPATFATNELELTVGGASNVPFTGGLFTPRLVNISIDYISSGVCPDIATVVSEGAGCGGSFASFYELQTPAAMDLANTQLAGVNSPAGYTVTAQPATINPIGSLGPVLPGPVGDDVSLAVGTLGLVVFSNGQVAFGAGNSTNWVPEVPVLLSNPATALYAWTDLSPNQPGSGQISYEESGTQYQVTYDGVHAFGTMDPSTIQFRGDTATGDFVIAFGALHTTGPENWLVGYSPGGPSGDPGPSDLSAATPGSEIVTPALDLGVLTLTPVGRPVQIATPVPYQVTTDNIPPGALAQIGVFGVTNPGVPLDGAGLPGCFLNASLDLLTFEVYPPNTTSHTWTAVMLPGFGPFRRVYNFNLQAVVFGVTNNQFLGLGAITSNGLKCRTGKL